VIMLKTALTAALIVAAFPAVAQHDDSSSAQLQPAAPPEAAAIQQAAMAFGQCVSAGVQALDAAVAPEPGAAGVAAGCASERDRLEQAAQTMIATLPEEQQPAAREQLRSQLAQVETRIAAGIRQRREAPAAAPTE